MIVLNIDKEKKHKKSLRKYTPNTPMHSKTLQQTATKIKCLLPPLLFRRVSTIPIRIPQK